MLDFSGVHPGDCLRVRADLALKRYDGCSATSEMREYRGLVVTIQSVGISPSSGKMRARIEEDPIYYWSAPMFEEPCPSKFVSLTKYLLGGESGG